MTLRDKLNASLKDAMKAKEAERLSTLRLINAAIKDRDIAARGEGEEGLVSDEVVLAILGKMVKQRQESARAYDEAGRLELAEKERALYAARTAQSRLIKAIVEAVGKERDKTSAYSASGAIEASQRHDPARPLGFDARL